MNSLTYSGAAAPRSSLQSLGHVGTGLVRPECVLATAHGDLYSADWRGGVAHRLPDGTQRLYSGRLPGGAGLRPNGIALLADGSFLIAHLGAEQGGVYRLMRDGRVEPWLLEVAGEALPPTNFVLRDAAGRTWVTVSTRLVPRALGYRRSCNDGFIACVQPDGRAAVVADGLGYTNEVALHPGGAWLYVNETFARRLSRFSLRSNGSLGARETVTEFGPGTFPDGLAFDEAGHAWVVSIVSNRLIRVAPDGSQTLWLEDADAEHLAWVEAAYEAAQMGRPHLDGVRSQVLRNISSIAFAGPQRRTAVLGCLLGDSLATLALPVAGAVPAHWNVA
ncbi:MAG: SMP-30/gluconolactonase/LRE family protein [Burkholderiales bacterium]|jgi:sugar lactone lactonase YvrE|nr:SMP-30/gluconolactonase/LRE family protein [Burkholderiales bacterium]